MTKKILITGACGFIASHLTRYVLQHTDWSVTALDRLDSAASQGRLRDCFEQYPDRIALIHHDLRAAVSDYVGVDILTGGRRWPLERFDYVAHLAAGSHVERSVASPVEFVLDNCLGTAHLLEFVRTQAAVKDDGRTLYFGTDEQFGSAPPGVSFKPWDRFNCLNPYAATKAGGDAIAVSFAHTYSMPIVVTRCGNAVGPDQHHEKFVPLAIAKVMHGESVPIHAVGGIPCSRLYVYVENVCSATVHILEHGTLLDGTDEGGRYNITASEEISNVDLVRSIGEILGVEARWHLVENPPGRLRPDLRYAIDGSALTGIGWRPSISFASGLEKTIESFARKKSVPLEDAANGGHPNAVALRDSLERPAANVAELQNG